MRNYDLFEYYVDITSNFTELNSELSKLNKYEFNKFMQIILKKCGKQYIIKLLEISLSVN
jgi:hypothetical protein